MKSRFLQQKLWNSDTFNFTSCCLESLKLHRTEVQCVALSLFHFLPSCMSVWLHFLRRWDCNLVLQTAPKPVQNMTQTHTPRFSRSENGYARHGVGSVRLGFRCTWLLFPNWLQEAKPHPCGSAFLPPPPPSEESGFASAALLIHECWKEWRVLSDTNQEHN